MWGTILSEWISMTYFEFELFCSTNNRNLFRSNSISIPRFPRFPISFLGCISPRSVCSRICLLLMSLTCRKMATTNCGDMNTFNMDHGYNEALIRGYRSGFLTENEYHHIAQCENIDGRTFPARRDYFRRCQAQPPGDRLR